MKVSINLILIFVEGLFFRWFALTALDIFSQNNYGGCIWEDCPNPYDGASLGLLVILVIYGLLIYGQTKLLDRKLK